jgi:hypothetical protein
VELQIEQVPFTENELRLQSVTQEPYWYNYPDAQVKQFVSNGPEQVEQLLLHAKQFEPLAQVVLGHLEKH